LPARHTPRRLLLAACTLLGTACDSITGADFDERVTAQYEGQLVETRVITAPGQAGATSTTTCTNTFALRGSVVVEFTREPDGSVRGRARVNDPGRTEVALSGPAGCAHLPPIPASYWLGPVTGSTGELRFRGEQVTSASGGSLTSVVEFAGALEGDVISGALTISLSGRGSSDGNDVALSGSTTLSITLQ
jgi:hypothetical protein